MLNNPQLAKLHYDIIRDTDISATPPGTWESLDAATQARHAQAIGVVRQQIAEGIRAQQTQKDALLKVAGQPATGTVT